MRRLAFIDIFFCFFAAIVLLLFGRKYYENSIIVNNDKVSAETKLPKAFVSVKIIEKDPNLEVGHFDERILVKLSDRGNQSQWKKEMSGSLMTAIYIGKILGRQSVILSNISNKSYRIIFNASFGKTIIREEYELKTKKDILIYIGEEEPEQ